MHQQKRTEQPTDVSLAIGVHPFHHLDVIGHKRRNVALQNCCVALDHVFIGHLGLVKLAYHCNLVVCGFSE